MKIAEARGVLEYIRCSAAIHKRGADWLEKTSVGYIRGWHIPSANYSAWDFGYNCICSIWNNQFWLTSKIEKDGK
jgi:hypothetical protein